MRHKCVICKFLKGQMLKLTIEYLYFCLLCAYCIYFFLWHSNIPFDYISEKLEALIRVTIFLEGPFL